jgi:hypothetical protein
MAAPIINGIAVLYPQGRSHKFPGEAAEILVDAVDADSHSIEVQVTVRDSSGTAVTQQAGVLQGDPLSFEAGILGPAGHTVTQDPAQPHRFVVV